MHLTNISSIIISFKHLLNRTVTCQYGLGIFTLDQHTLSRRCEIAQLTMSCPSFCSSDYDCHIITTKIFYFQSIQIFIEGSNMLKEITFNLLFDVGFVY